MVSVNSAEKHILAQVVDYGNESVSIDSALGRHLAEPVITDRDYPAGNRSTMDGIAISYRGLKRPKTTYKIVATQPAGVVPERIANPEQCIQVMTGAILDKSVDTVVRIEDVIITGNTARIDPACKISKGQFVHKQGSDSTKDKAVMQAGTVISAKEIAVLASLGYSRVIVKRLPKVVVVSTGDELVDVSVDAKYYQVRRSNDRALSSVLSKFSIQADRKHLPDRKPAVKKVLEQCIGKYDVLLSSGGVSMGKYDFVQSVLGELQASIIIHGVAQRPGKPFLFGKKSNTLIFAFPGNPVSSFLCMHRYFVPWLVKSQGQTTSPYYYGYFGGDFEVSELTQFIPTLTITRNGTISAYPVHSNGSGDFLSLAKADSFIEIPAKQKLKNRKLQRIWRII